MQSDVGVGECGASWGCGIPVRVVCVGNELAKDDGVGIRVGRVLRRLPLPDHISVSFYQELGFDLVELLASGERVIVVDAMTMGGRPGSCLVLGPDELYQKGGGTMACHAFGVAEMLDIARELGGTGQLAGVRLVGVEVEDVTGFGTTLTPCVARALPDAVGHVLQILDAPVDVLRAGRELAGCVPAELALADLHAG